jgi:hypothetical protein
LRSSGVMRGVIATGDHEVAERPGSRANTGISIRRGR